MSQDFRLASGGLIDRDKPLSFHWNNQTLMGRQGDTLASALLANGIRVVGRSFKYHRPRGIFTAGSEEPNALVTLRRGPRSEPNTRATMAELYEGLNAKSQNHRGSLKRDILAINDYLWPFLGAGFYYKTFMWPKAFWEKVYEPTIRAAAGLGELSGAEDPSTYDKGFLHCDVLVTGSGPAGLMAALGAGRSGARVILADEDFRMGGRLNAETHELGGMGCAQWAAEAAAELAAMPNVRMMARTTVYGVYDHGIHGALERKLDHVRDPGAMPRQVLWRIYARHSILCAGATERLIGFGNNDRPGIMLAGAARSYLNRFGVAPGRKVAVFTCCDDGWRTAVDLQASGIEVTAVIDPRAQRAPIAVPGAAAVMAGRIATTSGRMGLKQITLTTGQRFEADCLAVSGGWNPNLHLTCHLKGRPRWSRAISAFVPGQDLPRGMRVAGAANGEMTLAGALREGREAGNAAVRDLGLTPSTKRAPKASDEPHETGAFWHVGEAAREWIDLQNDVTVKDIAQSAREGFTSVEHLKRYTTLGMATDQGKTANVTALAVLADVTGRTIPETGTTIYRPPYSPVSIGALAGRSRGQNFRPTRLTPSHAWAEEQGAVFTEAGNWLRAQWFPQPGETHWRQSVDREVRTTRDSVGVCDVSTLGKIEVQGRDAGTFLDRVYANTFSTLAIGKVRYGLMLREDGYVYDDGTAARIGENHFVMTTTTANAVLVFRRLEFARQCLWPDLDVHLISTTDAWAQFSVAGPRSRAVLAKLLDAGQDISDTAFPYMACGEITVCGGTPARLFRISFSGERAYEIAVPARFGDALIRALIEAGAEFGITAYGTEALGVMRIEKGHPAGNELNGTTTALMLGLDRMVSRKKDCIGRVLSQREGLMRDDAMRLVGLVPVDRDRDLSAGAHFLSVGATPSMDNDEGWMTSVAYSPMLGHSIGLGFIRQGHLRKGEVVQAFDAVRDNTQVVEIVSPHFFDPEGERLRG